MNSELAFFFILIKSDYCLLIQDLHFFFPLCHSGVLGFLSLMIVTGVICVRNRSRLHYNQLGFRPVRNSDDDEEEDDYNGNEDFFHGHSSSNGWPPKAEARAADIFRDNPSDDEDGDEHSLFEKHLFTKK